MSSDTTPVQTEADVQAFPTVFEAATCTRKGLCSVIQIKKGSPLESHSIYFEQHGSGPEKILLIMGLNGTSFAWSLQVVYFGKKPEYSVLVFDKRGVGNSDTPKGPYSHESRHRTIPLPDYVGWTAAHDVHVVGGSMGGMIALKVATKIPERVLSLTLAVTRAKRNFRSAFPSVSRICLLVRGLTITQDPEVKISISQDMMYAPKWLGEKREGDPEGRTNREVETIEDRKRLEVTRPQKPLGALSQMVASVRHIVSPEELRELSKSIPKVLIVTTGDEDLLVDPAHSRYMKDHMPEAELVEWAGAGYGLHVQCRDQFNALLERVVKEGRERLANAGQ
ncbi:hypothetical protein FOMPIDRAFT_1123261 [Fomitopsis schrenkii]|uniref:AB hydrolase-1 domain-containing protein n=1 Tax=Fomitopsis schrenkii TaxID=2126942 RepID=S8EA29_FOMSC|nr:hypothetical protein FOMPIDRAFT_1123261 [Fomitopsis schrenkii]